MKRLLVAALLLLASAAAALAQTNPIPNSAQFGLAITSSTKLTVPTGANNAVVCARGGAANYSTDTSTAPTGSTGQQLGQNACISLYGQNVASFQAIQQTGNTTTLDVLYYR